MMTCFKTALSGLLFLILVTTSASAQSDGAISSDPIPCLLANHALDDLYRQALQPQCLTLAGDYCAKSPDAGACLAELNSTLQSLYAEIAAGLPETIDGDEAEAKRYGDAVVRAETVFSQNPDCQRYNGISLEACALKAFNEQIIIMIEYAEQTASWP